MTEKEPSSKDIWVDPDDGIEWSDEVWDRAEISVGGVVVREATGTLTKAGRPPLGAEAKKQVTLRLPPRVLEYFRNSGAGWQTRIGAVLERHVAGAAKEGSLAMPRGMTGVYAMAKNGTTSPKAAKAASKVLKSGSTGKDSKTAAGSALSQKPDKKK